MWLLKKSIFVWSKFDQVLPLYKSKGLVLSVDKLLKSIKIHWQIKLRACDFISKLKILLFSNYKNKFHLVKLIS